MHMHVAALFLYEEQKIDLNPRVSWNIEALQSVPLVGEWNHKVTFERNQ